MLQTARPESAARRLLGRALARAADRADEAGLGVVEVIVASLILMIVVISLGNMMISSLSAGLTARQRETAASLASDVVENAKAVGLAGFSSTSPGTSSGACTAYGTALRVLTSASGFNQCFTETVDRYTYTLTPTVTVGAPDVVTVGVAWGSGSTYSTSTDVGS